jgi:hypothetical protein
LRWYQLVPVQGDADYDLSGYLATEEAAGLGASLQINFLDAAGQPIAGNVAAHRGGTRGWEKVALRARSPANATQAVISAGLDGRGQAWFDDLALAPADGAPFAIEVDASAIAGPIRSLQGVNAGPRPIVGWEGLADVSDGYRDLGVDYVRTHDYYGPADMHVIFPDPNADPALASSYNFTSTDRELAAVKATGADILFRLGYSCCDIVEYVPPDRHAAWAEVARHVVMHYNAGWAPNPKEPAGFYWNIRYWEVWNEPDLDAFWTGADQEYYQLYAATARAIEAYDPALKVGGPALADDDHENFVRGFLAYCQANQAPLDFFSWHSYSTDPYDASRQAARLQNLLDEYGFSSAELILDEWNYTAGAPRDEYWNARGAAWTASVLAYLQDTRITISNRYRGNGGGDGGRWFGLFYDNGAYKKPAYTYRAFRWLLETPVRLAAAGSDTQGYAVLAGKSPDDRTVHILVGDLQSARTAYTLTVANLPWGAGQPYRYERYLLDETHDLTLAEAADVPAGSASFVAAEAMAAPSVQLIRLALQSGAPTPTASATATASPTGMPTLTSTSTSTSTASPTPPSRCVRDANANGIGDVVDIMTTAADADCLLYLPLVVANWRRPWPTATPTTTASATATASPTRTPTATPSPTLPLSHQPARPIPASAC